MKGTSLFLLCFIGLSLQENEVWPSVPLVVKSPYLNTWMSARELPGSWPTFWRGATRAFTGIVRVNNQAYIFMGGPIETKMIAKQTSLKMTPTQSIFTFTAGPIELMVNFFTPIDPTDLKRLSLPASYIGVSAKSLDADKHQIQVYFDMSGEWVSGDSKDIMEWDMNTINSTITSLNMRLKTPKVLQEKNEAALWGTLKFFTTSSATYEASPCATMRAEFVKSGRLSNTIDNKYRAIEDNWPGVGFAHEITAGPKRSAEVYLGVAHVRRPAISYTVGQFNQLWESYFNGNDNSMVEFFYTDRNDALKRAQSLDAKIVGDARKVGGESYVKAVSAALRQAYGGIELVGTPEKPWYMVKEISSDGNCQTVDIIYPHFPIQLYLNPKNIRYLLDPLLDNQERGFFPKKYCMHDLGFNYPRCTGHRDGNEEGMEVEESGNMLIMMAAYVKATRDKDFAVKHYKIAKQWADYLVEHGLITGNALTTDDFLGKIKNSTNLSIKAIIGIGGMAQLADHAANHNDQQHYRQIAEKYVKEWIRLGEDPSGKHMKLSYNTANTWFMIYNLYADVILETKLVPDKIYKQQEEWYLKMATNKYGINLEGGKNATKIDWQFFTAASSTNQKLRQTIFDKTALLLKETKMHVPFQDYCDTESTFAPGFLDRPVIGGVFAPLTVKH